MTVPEQASFTLPADRLSAAIDAGVSGSAADPGAVEAYLAGIEAAIDARVDERVQQGLGRQVQQAASCTRSFTSRAIGSLAVGIPLTAVSGSIAGRGGSLGSLLGVLGALLAIVVLNVYYTEVEKDLEKERIRAGRP